MATNYNTNLAYSDIESVEVARSADEFRKRNHQSKSQVKRDSMRASKSFFSFKVKVSVTVMVWFISIISLFAFLSSYENGYTLVQCLPGILVSGLVWLFTSSKLGLFK